MEPKTIVAIVLVAFITSIPKSLAILRGSRVPH